MNWTVIIVVGSLALIAIVAFLIFRKSTKVKVSVRGPGGMGVDVEASTKPRPSSPGVHIEGAKAGRDIKGEDATGQGAVLKDVDAGRDVRGTATRGDDPSKKA